MAMAPLARCIIIPL